MENILNFIRTDTFLIIISIVSVLLLLLTVINNMKIRKLKLSLNMKMNTII